MCVEVTQHDGIAEDAAVGPAVWCVHADAAGRLAFGETPLDAARTCLGSRLGPMRGRDGNVHRGRPRDGRVRAVVVTEGQSVEAGALLYTSAPMGLFLATYVNFLIANGVSPQHLVAAGFGEFQPIDPGSTEEAKSRNRRIELKLTER